MSTHVVDCSAKDFDRVVLARSRELPVMVDFWAPWCGPCRFLAPVLEKIVDELQGAILLAKVNTDENPELAAGYGVSGIPHVALFKDGRVADQFVGALPEAQVRTWLRAHVTTEADRRAAASRAKLEDGDVDGARAGFEAALAQDPACDGAHVGLALVSLRGGDSAAAAAHARAVSGVGSESDRASGILRAVELLEEAGEIGDAGALADRVKDHPSDVAAHYGLGIYAIAAGRLTEALDSFLCAAKADKKWRDEAPRKAMLVVFALLGARHPLSDLYREKLRALYY